MKFSCTESNFFIARWLTVEQVTLLVMAPDYPACSAVLSVAIWNIPCELLWRCSKNQRFYVTRMLPQAIV